MASEKTRLPALTGLRFILALWVIFFHQADPTGLLGPWLSHAPVALVNLVRTGYVAVSGFFVLSGFILAYNYSLETWWSRKQVVRFAIARFARIYPVYCVGWLLMLLSFAANLARGTASVGKTEVRSLLLTVGLLQAWDPSSALSWNRPGWSLSDEVFFYACFPLLGPWLWKRRSPMVCVGALAAAWVVALAVPAIATLTSTGYGPASAYGEHALGAPASDSFWMTLIKFNPGVRLAEFCAGILICRLWLFLKETYLDGKGYWLYLPGFAGILAVLSWAGHLPYLPVHDGLLMPLFACVILGLALQGGLIAGLLGHPLLVFLGQASYGVYTLHFPISWWMSTNVAQKVVALSGLQGMAIYTLVVVGVASLVFKYIEEPMNRRLKVRLGEWFGGRSPAAELQAVRPLSPASPDVPSCGS